MDTEPAVQSTVEMLMELLAERQVRYAADHPKCEQAALQRARSGPGGTNRPSIFFDPFPLTFSSADGATLTTVDGDTLVDFQGNMTAGLFGHSDVVRQAVAEAMESGWSMGGHNENEGRVAAEFTARFPCCEMVKFCNTGTEATTYAINTARAVSGRSKVLMYTGAYHGAYIHGVANDRMSLEIPYEKVLVDYNADAAEITAAIREHGADLACVLIEPVAISPYAYLKTLAPKSYLEAVRDVCTECNVALIFDEVMTSRLAPGGAQELVGVSPDMFTCGKYFAGGLNFGAFGGRKQWMARHDPHHEETLATGGTFNQNAVSMAAAAAVLGKLWTPDLCRAHNAKGDWLRERINAIAQEHGAPCQAHGCGSLVNISFREKPMFDDDATMMSDWKETRASAALGSSIFFFAMLERGFLVGTPGYVESPDLIPSDTPSYRIHLDRKLQCLNVQLNLVHSF